MLPIEKLPKGYWVTADGRLMEFEEMNPSHLLNVERMLRGEGMSEATHLNVEQRVKALKSARREIRKRGLTARPSLRDDSVFDTHHFRFLVSEYNKAGIGVRRAAAAVVAMEYLAPRMKLAFPNDTKWKKMSLSTKPSPDGENEFSRNLASAD